MGIRIILDTLPTNSYTYASASQPRRNGPIVTTTTPMTLKAKILRDLQAVGPQGTYEMSRRFNASEGSVAATVRDLRKDGYTINYNVWSGKYEMATLTPVQQMNASYTAGRWAA